jgi:hydroxymethylpyrimidine/phosphomethylpyrimidine kinase
MSERSYRTALTIAGTDPSGGAGINADIRTFVDHNVLALTVITSVNAQNTSTFSRADPVEADGVTSQLQAVFSDIPVDAIKIGMLGTASQARAVAAFLRGLDVLPSIVIDPVLKSSSGTPLLDDEGILVLQNELLTLATLITPNRAEARILAGSEDCETWAADSAFAVLITGGDEEGDQVVDRLFDEAQTMFSAPRIADGPGVRGTGCSLSSAIAAQLALGRTLQEAIEASRIYVRERIAGAVDLGAGRRVIVSAR